MSENKTETPAGKEPVKESASKPINWQMAFDHSTKIKTELVEKYSGKPGVNPYLWIAQNVDTLDARYDKGERSLELYTAYMSLTTVVPDGKSLAPDSIRLRGSQTTVKPKA